MCKSKVSAIIITILMILVLISMIPNTFARSSVSISGGTLNVTEDNVVKNWNNVYCVSIGRDIVSSSYTVVASVEIRGDKVTYNGTEKTDNSGLSHLMAAILTEADVNGNNQDEHTYLDAYGFKWEGNDGTYYYTPRQMAVWYQWLPWVNQMRTLFSGIPLPQNNNRQDAIEGTDWSYATEIKDACEAKINSGTKYAVRISYIENSGNTSQQLIVTEQIPVVVPIDITFTKVWDDNGNSNNIRPTSLVIQLYKDGSPVNGQRVTLTSDNVDSTNSNKWKYTFEDLEEGPTYTIKEVSVPTGYKCADTTADSGNNYTITNEIQTTKLDVEKVWNDNNDSDGVRPGTITVYLYENGTKVSPQKSLTLKPKNNPDNGTWTTGTFNDLPKYVKDGNTVREAKYTAIDELGDSYTETQSTSGGKTTITNTHTPEETKVIIQKIWDDDDNRDGYRPSSIKVRLYAGDERATDKNGNIVGDIELNASNDWKYEISGLFKKKNGSDIVYKIQELDNSNLETYYNAPVYETDGAGTTVITLKVTNKHDSELVEIPVTKIWDDDNDRDGYRNPITVTLYADGVEVDTLTISEEDGWTGTFKSHGDVKLYKYKHNKQLIKYSIVENQVNHYEAPKYGIGNVEPESSASGTITGNTQFNNTNTSGFKIKNKHVPEETEITIQKIWEDDGNRDNYRKPITVKLLANGKDATYKNGTKIGNIQLSGGNDSNIWEKTISGLYKKEDGSDITYTIQEVSTLPYYESEILETEYTKTADGKNLIILKLENTHEPELVEIPVTKTWYDDTDRDGLRPEIIKFKLYADGKHVDTLEISGDKNSNTWTGTFKSHDNVKLYKYRHYGELIKYTVVEEVISNHKDYNPDQKYDNPIYVKDTTTGNQTPGDTKTDGFEIENMHDPELLKVKIVKVWTDNNDLDEYRPSSITLKLFANDEPAKNAEGEDVSTIVLNAPNEFTNTWETTIENLYRYYDHGKEIKYTIKEVQNYEHKEKYTVDIKTPEFEYNKDLKMKVFTLIAENTHEPEYAGYKEITGKVWIDRRDGKANDINGIIDDDESGLKGIKVILRAENGDYFDDEATSVAYTDENGNYAIKINYDTTTNVYKLHNNPSTIESRLAGAYVEFEYDGMKYTTVKDMVEKKTIIDENGQEQEVDAESCDQSKAREDEVKRNQFDAAHAQVTPSTKHPDEWTDKGVTAITKNVISFANYSDKTDKTSTEVLKYCTGSLYERTNPEGAWEDILTSTKYMSSTKHPNHTICSGSGHAMTKYDVEVEVIQNVNLGLFEREKPDVAIFSDLSEVVVTMNGQQYTYLYNVRSNENNDVGLQVKFENKDTYTYRRPVNPADIAYVNQEGNGNVMTVEVTYQVRVANLSTTLQMTVHNIINSYDSRYTLKNEGWTSTTGAQFNQATYNGDLNIKLEPQTESEIIELTYSISAEAIKSLLNQEATLNNAVEVQSFTTTYGANTLYAEQRTGGRTNQPYAGYDYDSHPGNAEIFINSEGRLEAAKPEDDTDIAPSFVLCKDEEKRLSGNVWEDSDYNTQDDERIGDGKKADEENNLANAKVELYKVKDDGTTELANLYYSDGRDPIPAVAYSNDDGYYTFGEDGSCGVVTDIYIIKFTYGEGIVKEDGSTTSSTINELTVNARNYKSTIIALGDKENTEQAKQQENKALYNLFKNEEITDYDWHLKTPDGYSIAVDNMEERIAIEDLQYSNFSDAIYMTAYSKPFKMQVEFDGNSEKTTSVGTDGETGFGKELSIFDFGIIERAKEDIFVEKTIDYVKVTLANGQVLVEGNPEDSLNYVKAAGFYQEITNGLAARSALSKRLVIEMDAELIQQAQLNIRYLITVTNNSEIDFDYYVNDQIKTEYYYFGTNLEDQSPIIKGSVNKLIDYIDTDYNFNWEYSDNWTEVTASNLNVEGQELVSDTTLATITNNNYKAYTTEMFSEVGPGESKSDYAYASKLLANQDENKYENHIEILQIDAKTARTIGTDEDGNTIQKQYKPGNYVPSLEKRVVNDDINNEQSGVHEQDDDNVEVVITPPTGATEYIIKYLAAGLAGMIVISLGVIFIKKKVLTK